MGTAIARTIGRSIVQLNVSVRGVAGRLSDVTGPVIFSRTGDLAAIEAGMRKLEGDIGNVVERLQQRETELLRAEQLARVGQLAAGLAHELRNPLMPMKVLVQAAIERDDGEGLKGRSLKVLNDEIGRLENSIQTFLDFARPPVPEKTSGDVREIVSGTLELVAGRAHQQNVDIQTQLPAKAVNAQVDRAQIRQLILNLLLNALDALPTGGRIEVVLEPQATPPVIRAPEPSPESNEDAYSQSTFSEHDAMRLLYEPPRPTAKPAVRWWAVRIADSGSGIPTEMLATIFEPFVTTKETGTGLGLSICRRVATAHGGQLLAANRPTGGAEFTLLLPYDSP
jgi:signal transduction histidine kinase